MKLKNLKVAATVFGLAITSYAAQAQAQQGAQNERKGPPSADKIIEKLDANKDGKLSLEEVQADDRKHLEENFDLIDTDKDGFISKEELEAKREQRTGKRKRE